MLEHFIFNSLWIFQISLNSFIVCQLFEENNDQWFEIGENEIPPPLIIIYNSIITFSGFKKFLIRLGLKYC